MRRILRGISAVVGARVNAMPCTEGLKIGSDLISDPDPVFVTATAQRVVRGVDRFRPETVVRSIAFREASISSNFVEPGLIVKIER